jgi:acetyl esterase/lipase
MKILVSCFCLLIVMKNVSAQEIIPLYNGAVPGNKQVIDKETSDRDDDGRQRIHHTSKPTLEIFVPAAGNANGTAIIICPGGGYSYTAYSHEGTDVAKQMNLVGVTAFVLKYRIPDDAVMENKTIAPLQDAQQAIKFVRENAAKWSLRTDRIGILGFSAGGHLASTAGTHFYKPVIENKNGTSLRPDYMILVYPVISFNDSIAHIGSRNNLLGNNPPDSLIAFYSNELQVRADTPPTFLVHASDDGGVNPLNSVRFYEALLKNKVPAEMHLYKAGGHGFGLNNRKTPEKWMDACKGWMDSNGWLKQ